MHQTFRVAVIGCGGRGKAHAVGIAADPRCRVVAAADPNVEAAEQLCKAHGFDAAIYADYHDMLKAERPEVVVASLWTPMHLAVIRDCAEAGARAVLSEKPMAATWSECLAIAKISEDTGCRVSFSHQRRFAAGNRLARQLISEGVFGKAERIDLYSPQNLLDCGTHTLDQALSFLGERPAKWVLGAVDTSKTLNWFNVRSETVAVGVIVFDGGVRASLQVGGPDMDIGSGVRFTGDKGFFEVNWDGEFQRALVYNDPSWKLQAETKRDEAEQMVGMIRDQITALERGIEPELSYKNALRASEIIFALYESVKRRARVDLPLEAVTGNPLHDVLGE